MPIYFYTASSQQGGQISGREQAEDERDLARKLREEGYVLTFAQLESQKKRDVFAGFWGIFTRVSLTEKLMFVRNLKVMVGAGIAIPKALEILSHQTKSNKFRRAILQMQEQVTRGKTLSQAMGDFPDIFSELSTNVIKVGEESGTLENVLSNLIVQLEREYGLKSKIKGALLYPAVIVSAMVGIGILMLVFVVPKLASTFEELGVALPATTRVVIWFGKFLATKWYVLILGLLVLVIILYRASQSMAGKRALDRVLLQVPFLSGVIKKINLAFTARTLSSLMGAGVPIVRSLEITSNVVGNIYFSQALRDSADEVKEGLKLSQALGRVSHLYPPVFTQMVEVGEETGETTEILSKLADFYEEEITTVTKNISSIIEPVLMLVIGAVIGFFAISLIQPLYSMLSAIK